MKAYFQAAVQLTELWQEEFGCFTSSQLKEAASTVHLGDLNNSVL